MTDIDDINDAILTNLTSPKRVQVGDTEVEMPSISDQIKAGEYIAGQEAVASGRTGLRFFQIIPPGGGGTP